MHLKSLQLHQFRNLKKGRVQFSPGVNLLVGRNAQGKTNLVEAVHLLMTGRSFRTQRLSELAQNGQTGFFIEGLIYKHKADQRISFGLEDQSRRVLLNQSPCPSRDILLGFLRGVLLGPHDQQIIKGSPAVRRQYLDVQLAQTDPVYVCHLSRYHRALKHYNTMLRKRQAGPVGIWQQELARSGAYVSQARQKTVLALSDYARALFRDLACFDAELELRYRQSCEGMESLVDLAGALLSRLEKEHSKASGVGYALSGPHRDDLLILCGGKAAKTFASEGQQRLCVAAMKLAEWQRMRDLSDESPLMILDEVGVSLDSKHRERLLGQLHQRGQVFLTSADDLDMDIPHERFEVAAGALNSLEAAIVN